MHAYGLSSSCIPQRTGVSNFKWRVTNPSWFSDDVGGDEAADAAAIDARHRDEPSLRWRRAKLGRKHCSQDEADRASKPAAAWEPPVDLRVEKMDLLEEIMEEGIQFSFSYSTIGYGHEIHDRQLPAT